jgi:D-alanine-D-alanine ligase
MSQKNLIIAFGGPSPEHEVSVITAMQTAAALKNRGYHRIPLYINKSGRWFTGAGLLELENFRNLKKLEELSTPCYFTHNTLGQTVLKTAKKGLLGKSEEFPVYAVLAAFHGSGGENGSFQGVCETYNVPYTGSSVLGSSVGMDKVIAKNLCRSAGIPVAGGIDFFEREWVQKEASIVENAEKLGYPLVVKPVHLGSSIGVEIVKNMEELTNAVETAFRYDAHLLIEEAISPLMEINCSVLGTPQGCRASVCERPLGKDELLSFKDKYMGDEATKGMASASRIIPADIDDELADQIRSVSKKIFRLLGCSGVARLDFLVNSETGKYYFNEINTIPGSFSFYLWKESGLSFSDLLDELISIAVEEHERKNGRIQSYETNLLSEKAVTGLKGLKGSK